MRVDTDRGYTRKGMLGGFRIPFLWMVLAGAGDSVIFGLLFKRLTELEVF